MKKLFLIVILFTAASVSQAQERFLTRAGHIKFFSAAPMENIEAHNHQVTAVVDANGEIAFKVIMKSFDFEKAAMQEHFNKQYLHTDKYPEAKFEGKITNISSVNLKKDGSYPAQIEGKLTIHGITKNIEQRGTIVVKGGNVVTNAKFSIKLADYEVKVPSDFSKKISETVEITVDCTLAPYTR